jgi:hypothetical protein
LVHPNIAVPLPIAMDTDQERIRLMGDIQEVIDKAAEGIDLSDEV